jgi:YggT family protein
MRAILDIVLLILDIYTWIMIAMIVMSWLVAFNIVNTRQQFVQTVWQVLRSLTEPVLRPIRRILPQIQGIDLSPIVVFLGIILIRNIIAYYIWPNVF